MKPMFPEPRSRGRAPLRKAVAMGVALLACVMAAGTSSAGNDISSRARSLPALSFTADSARRAAAAAVASEREQWHEQSLATLAKESWRWLISIPPGVTPMDDVDGVNCGINQDGRFWFLGAPVGADRSCVVAAGRAIVVPVFVAVNDYPCPDPSFKPAPGQSLEEFLRSGIGPIMDEVSLAEARLDGRSLRVRRVTTNVFSFTGAAGLAATFDPCITGSPQVGVSDGYWALVEPLPPGDYVLQMRTVSVFGALDGAYRLKVRPAGQ
jgi:hypothetical protein